jgi:hypothetical protein
MTPIELKKYLVRRISEIDDEAFLEAIRTILDSKTESKILSLPEELKLEIAESKNQIKQGSFLNQEELDLEFDKWLSGK